jgi:hypothetical protein
MNQDSAAKLYNRRAKSIANGNAISPAAAPSSGQSIMFNDMSATQLKDNNRDNNEVVVHSQNSIPENPAAENQQREDTVENNNSETA